MSAPANGKDGCLGCGGLLFLVIVLAIFTADDPKPAPSPAPAPVAAPAAVAPPAPPPPGHDLVPAVEEVVKWERRIYIEARTIEKDEGWTLPDSAKVLRKERRLRLNDDDELVNATYYWYREPVWRRSRMVRARGDTSAPAWPRVRLRPTEREAERTEAYTVTLRAADGERHFLNLPLSEWTSYRPGRRIALRRSWEGLDFLAAISVDSARLTVLPADSLPACREWRAGGAAPADSLGCSPPATK